MWFQIKTLLVITLVVMLCACSDGSSGDASLALSTATSKELTQNPAVLHLTAPPPESSNTISSKDTPLQAKAQLTVKSQAYTPPVYSPVTRIQNTNLYGAYFFTIDDAERAAALQANPNWQQEGVAFYAALTPDQGILNQVHRFRNLHNGSYLYTTYDEEVLDIISNYSSTFVYEGVAWYARRTTSYGWVPLYRFRNLQNGTYLFSAYESEKDAIVRDYPTVFKLEGIAYYVKSGPTPVITVPAPKPQNVKVYITPANTLPVGCNFDWEDCWADSVNNGTVIIINGGAQKYAYYRAFDDGILYDVERTLGSNGLFVYPSRSVTDNGVSSRTDWIMGTASGYIVHDVSSNTCWNQNANQVACPP